MVGDLKDRNYRTLKESLKVLEGAFIKEKAVVGRLLQICRTVRLVVVVTT